MIGQIGKSEMFNWKEDRYDISADVLWRGAIYKVRMGWFGDGAMVHVFVSKPNDPTFTTRSCTFPGRAISPSILEAEEKAITCLQEAMPPYRQKFWHGNVVYVKKQQGDRAGFRGCEEAIVLHSYQDQNHPSSHSYTLPVYSLMFFDGQSRSWYPEDSLEYRADLGHSKIQDIRDANARGGNS